MELQNLILSEVTCAQKYKYYNCHLCGSQPLAVNIYKHIYKPGKRRGPCGQSKETVKEGLRRQQGQVEKGIGAKE